MSQVSKVMPANCPINSPKHKEMQLSMETWLETVKFTHFCRFLFNQQANFRIKLHICDLLLKIYAFSMTEWVWD